MIAKVLCFVLIAFVALSEQVPSPAEGEWSKQAFLTVPSDKTGGSQMRNFEQLIDEESVEKSAVILQIYLYALMDFIDTGNVQEEGEMIEEALNYVSSHDIEDAKKWIPTIFSRNSNESIEKNMVFRCIGSLFDAVKKVIDFLRNPFGLFKLMQILPIL